MSQPDRIEFYCEGKCVSATESSMRPVTGEFINIKSVTYKVLRVTFALDYSGSNIGKQWRCNVEMEVAK